MHGGGGCRGAGAGGGAGAGSAGAGHCIAQAELLSLPCLCTGHGKSNRSSHSVSVITPKLQESVANLHIYADVHGRTFHV